MGPSPAKVAICIPSGDDWSADFALSLLDMKEQAMRDGIEAIVLNVRGSILPRSRHDLVRIALAKGATHVLFMDSDIKFPPDTLTRLLAHGKAVVGAICPMRRLNPESNCLSSLAHDVRIPPDPAAGLVKVAAVGTGIMLLQADLFRQIPPPWFLFGFSQAHDSYCGEDVFLCVRIMEVTGQPIYADLSFSHQVAHVGAHRYAFDGAQLEPVRGLNGRPL